VILASLPFAVVPNIADAPVTIADHASVVVRCGDVAARSDARPSHSFMEAAEERNGNEEQFGMDEHVDHYPKLTPKSLYQFPHIQFDVLPRRLSCARLPLAAHRSRAKVNAGCCLGGFSS